MVFHEGSGHFGLVGMNDLLFREQKWRSQGIDDDAAEVVDVYDPEASIALSYIF